MATEPTYLVIAADGAQYGPITESDLRAWIQERLVNGQSQAWQEGSAEWKPLCEHAAFRGSFAPPSPPPVGSRAAKQSAWTKPILDTPAEVLAKDLAKGSKNSNLMRYVWQITIAVVVGVGILLSKMNWSSTANLETQVRKSIEENFRKNANTRGTQVLSFHLVHSGGNKYNGTLEAMTALKTETVKVDVTYDGRTFEWKILPAASSPVPAVADKQPEPRPISTTREPPRQPPSIPTSFDTTDKSIADNGNMVVAVQKLQAGAPKVVEKTSIEEVTKNPYAALGKVCEFRGEIYKVEATAPNPVMKGPWTEILILVPNENNPTGVTTVDLICKGDASRVNAGDEVTFSGYFIGTYEGQNAVGGTVEGIALVGDSLRTASPVRNR